jgi:hypothetical protein
MAEHDIHPRETDTEALTGVLYTNSDELLGRVPVEQEPSWIMASEQEFFDAHPGIIPVRYDPADQGEALDRILTYQVMQVIDHVAREQRGVNVPPVDPELNVRAMPRQRSDERPAHHNAMPPELQQPYEYLSNVNYYNVTHRDNGSLVNADLGSPEAIGVRHRTEAALRRVDPVIILPFVDKEAITIGIDAEYVADVGGKERMLLVHAGDNRSLDEEMRERGFDIVNQRDILRLVDWDRMREMGILPRHFRLDLDNYPMKGTTISKGATMLTGLITMEAMGLLVRDGGLQRPVCFHDTDIMNPDEYDALRHMMLPYAYRVGGQDPEAVHIARNGSGRRNEPWTIQTNVERNTALAMLKARMLGRDMVPHLSDRELQRRTLDAMRLEIIMGTYTWPLTGERIVDARDLPLSTGMGIETILDVGVAGKDVRNRTNTIAQVADPAPKTENGISTDSKDFALISLCTVWQKNLADHIMRTGRMPHEWSVDDIRDFNLVYGGMPNIHAAPSDHPNASPHHAYAPSEFVLPSLKQIREIEAATGRQLVDWQGVRGILDKGRGLR